MRCADALGDDGQRVHAGLHVPDLIGRELALGLPDRFRRLRWSSHLVGSNVRAQFIKAEQVHIVRGQVLAGCPVKGFQVVDIFAHAISYRTAERVRILELTKKSGSGLGRYCRHPDIRF